MILPLLYNIEWINDDFSETIFFYKKFAYSASVKIRSWHSLCAEYRVLAKLNKCFWSRIWKIWFKTCELAPTRPACCDCKCKNFPSRKITVRFKLNLKTDGLICKMIFKFGSRIERLHSTRKQGRRIYNVCICKQCVCLYKHHLRCKILVGNTQTLELHLVDASCFKQIKRENRFTSCGILRTATLPMPT